MGWWRPDSIQVTHEPSGHRVILEGRSFHKLRAIAKRMIAGKLWADANGAGRTDRLVRSYDLIEDPEGTTRILDGHVDIRPLDPTP